ncbi:MAG: hypothetical protein AAFX44_05190 [Pseudomonadota bacterium]
MKRLCVYWLLLLTVQANAQVNVDVLLVFHEGLGLSAAEKTTVSADYQLALEQATAALVNSTIRLRPTFIDLEGPKKPDGTPEYAPSKVTKWLHDENADVLSLLRQSRDFILADLVLMVVPQLDGACGVAGYAERAEEGPPRRIDVYNSEQFAFAAVEYGACDHRDTVPHEIGHLLYAEHEKDEFPVLGSPGATTDSNRDKLAPAINNHGHTQNTLRSIMYSAWSSTKSRTLWSGAAGVFDSDTTFANNQEFLAGEAFATVSQYRGPPPGSCDPQIVLQMCQGSLVLGQFTAKLPGHNVLSARYEIRRGFSGPFEEIYEGPLICPSTTMLPGEHTVRAILETVNGLSQCELHVALGECDSGGGGPGPIW